MSQEIAARATLREAHRLVVKLGTAVVTTEDSELATSRVANIVEGIAAERKVGRDVVLVTSGAVGMGMRLLGLRQRPRSLGLRQACAAVGQGHLMAAYAEAFSKQGLIAAQVLLTQEDFGDRDRALCVRTTLMRLLELGAIPVLNENDSVSIRELVEHQRRSGAEPPTRVFGDNDGLAARVAVALDADLLVLLTNVDGLFTANPKIDPNAKRVPFLASVDGDVLDSTNGTSSGGTGGMLSKLEAARLATAEGTTVVIANGSTSGILSKILAGDEVGTLISTLDRRRARLRFIAVASKRFGAVVVNDGALAALEKGKASLLPVGVIAVEGSFDKGDVVEIRDGSGRVRGRGMVNYDADACRKLAGRQSDDIDAVLGYRGYDALITRDNLVMGAT